MSHLRQTGSGKFMSRGWPAARALWIALLPDRPLTNFYQRHARLKGSAEKKKFCRSPSFSPNRVYVRLPHEDIDSFERFRNDRAPAVFHRRTLYGSCAPSWAATAYGNRKLHSCCDELVAVYIGIEVAASPARFSSISLCPNEMILEPRRPGFAPFSLGLSEIAQDVSTVIPPRTDMRNQYGMVIAEQPLPFKRGTFDRKKPNLRIKAGASKGAFFFVS
jgi:hypothetical protein